MKIKANSKIKQVPIKSDMGRGYGLAIYGLTINGEELGVNEIIKSGSRNEEVDHEFEVTATNQRFPSIIDALINAGHEVEYE